MLNLGSYAFSVHDLSFSLLLLIIVTISRLMISFFSRSRKGMRFDGNKFTSALNDKIIVSTEDSATWIVKTERIIMS